MGRDHIKIIIIGKLKKRMISPQIETSFHSVVRFVMVVDHPDTYFLHIYLQNRNCTQSIVQGISRKETVKIWDQEKSHKLPEYANSF